MTNAEYQQRRDAIVERWKPVVGYEGMYEVSDQGSVRSLTRKTPGRWGTLKTNPGKVIKQVVGNVGYMRVCLSSGGKSRKMFVHRLVASAFLPPDPVRTYVNHKDCDKLNNQVENLEWCTPFENSSHANANGKIKWHGYKSAETKKRVRDGLNAYWKRRKVVQSRLTSSQVVNIYHCRGAIGPYHLGRLYGRTPESINNLWKGRTYSNQLRQELRNIIKGDGSEEV